MLSHRRFERSTVLFIGLMVLSFVLTTVDVRGEGEGIGDTVRTGAQSIFGPVQKAASAVTRPIVGFFDGVANLASLREENEQLRADIAALEVQLEEGLQDQKRLEELEKINDLEAPEGIDTVTARVIAGGPSDFDHIRRIDKGLSHGLAKGMAVIDERGLVGRIVSVTQTNATVRLITDPLSTVGVRVLSTGENGWVTGRGAGALEFTVAGPSRDVRQGDLLVTSGGRFPPDIGVARVSEGTNPGVGFILETRAEPLVEFSRLDFVKILLTAEGDEPLGEPEEEPPRIPVDETPEPGSPGGEVEGQ